MQLAQLSSSTLISAGPLPRRWCRNMLVFGVVLHTMLAFTAVHAATVAGVELGDSVMVEGHAEPLRLNGAGVRKKLFIKVYVGALYLPAVAQNRADAQKQGAKRIHLNVLRDISADRVQGAWGDGFSANLPPDTMAVLEKPIARFNALFGDFKKGDVVTIDLLSTYVRVQQNNALLGTVEHEGLPGAVLDIWLGEKPADGSLKEAMLAGASS